jgi:hypothetical protein
MTLDWTAFERPSDFNRWKPETEGDSIAGKIKSMRVATMPDGSKYPSLTIISNGDDFEVLASQTQLLRLLAEKKPEVGDTIAITYTKLERLNAGKTMKHFTVEVSKGKTVDPNDIA